MANLCPIMLYKVSWKGTELMIKAPLKLTPYVSEDKLLLIVKKPEIELHVFARTRNKLIDEINEQIVMMYYEYCLCDSLYLTKDSQLLKKSLLKILRN